MSKLTYFYPVGYGVGAAMPTQGGASFSTSANGSASFSASTPAAKFSVSPVAPTADGGSKTQTTSPAPVPGPNATFSVGPKRDVIVDTRTVAPPVDISVTDRTRQPRPRPKDEPLVPGGGPWPWLPGPTPRQPEPQEEPKFRMTPPLPTINTEPVMQEVRKSSFEYCIPVRTSYGAYRCSPADFSDP